MNKIVLLTSGFFLSIVPLAGAQYGGDPYRGYVDQMVIDNMNTRRSAEARRASRGKQKKYQKKSRSSTSKKARPSSRLTPVTGQLFLSQDMYSDFGSEDGRAFTLEVRLSPTSGNGKPITKWAKFSPSKGDRSVQIGGLPPGRYAVAARVLDENRNAIPALLGTRCGEPTDPNGGDFAASKVTQLTLGKDPYGRRAVQGGSLWFRPQARL